MDEQTTKRAPSGCDPCEVCGERCAVVSGEAGKHVVGVGCGDGYRTDALPLPEAVRAWNDRQREIRLDARINAEHYEQDKNEQAETDITDEA